ncbi:SymE family type I addiction module toxin [Culturomica massiliensis]
MPSIPLAGVWLKNAGFEVGDFAHIVVMDGVLVVRCERLLDNENREK